VRRLRRAGINAGVLMAPLVPGVTTSRAALEATVRAIADHDASFMGANVLRLEGGTRDHFLAYLDREYPHLAGGYRRLYPEGTRAAPAEYTRAVKQSLAEVRAFVGLKDRDDHVP